MTKYFIDPDIAKAKTISTDIYLDREVYTLIKEKVFVDAWLYVTDTDQVMTNESVYPFTYLPGCLDEPLLLSKDKDGVLHCLSNVCTHRGNLLVSEPCHLRNIRCKYHGRRFGLNGVFSFMPEFSKVKGFPSAADDLRSLPLFQWGKFLFTTIGNPPKATGCFSEMMERMSWLPLDNFRLRPDLSRDFEVDANWALYCENYLEGFHIPFVHSGLNEVLDYGSYTTELFSHSSLQLGLASEGELAFDLPEESLDFGKRVAGYYFWVFPNMMFNFYPWGLSINIVKPQSKDKTVVTFLTYMWDESKFEQGAGADLIRVEQEDEQIVESVQKGVRSRFYQHGRYAPEREQGTHHFHQLLANALE